MIAELRCPNGHPARSSSLVEPVTTIDPETGRLVPTPDEDADAREVAL